MSLSTTFVLQTFLRGGSTPGRASRGLWMGKKIVSGCNVSKSGQRFRSNFKTNFHFILNQKYFLKKNYPKIPSKYSKEILLQRIIAKMVQSECIIKSQQNNRQIWWI